MTAAPHPVPPAPGAPGDAESPGTAPLNPWAVAAAVVTITGIASTLLGALGGALVLLVIPGLFLGIQWLGPDRAGRRRHRATTPLSAFAIVAGALILLAPLLLLLCVIAYIGVVAVAA